jgi:hypothetical protein
LTPKYFTNYIKDEVFSSFLSFAILPLELRMIEGKSSDEPVLPEELESSSSSKPAEFFFQQNNIIKDPLNIILLENNKKAILNNSGFYTFLNLLKNNNIGQKKFTLITLDNDHYLATSHNIDLDLLDVEVENDDSKSIPKKVVLLHLSKKEIVNNSNFAIIKSILTFTSFRENRTKLQIFVYSGILDDFLRINNEQLLNSVEIFIKILGLSGTPEEIFSEHDPNGNMYLFSNLDDIKFGTLEIPIHNLGTKNFMKFNSLDESADFELIIRNNGQEISFKLRIIDNTTTVINVLIIGNRK